MTCMFVDSIENRCKIYKYKHKMGMFGVING